MFVSFSGKINNDIKYKNFDIEKFCNNPAKIGIIKEISIKEKP